MTTGRAETLTVTALFNDTRLLVILFLTFRIGMLLVGQPLITTGGERGVTTGGDFFYYYQLGALSADGALPFRDWWSEFPPIPSLLNTLLYQIAGRESYSGFAVFFGVLMLLCDLGCLLLVRRIGGRVYGVLTGSALAWLYALLLAPTVFIWWNFEPLVAFLLLAGLSAALDGADRRSAVLVLIGALVKFTPAILIGAIWRMRPARVALRYSAIVGGGFVIVYALLFAQNAAMTAPSLLAQFNKASYQSIWALIDGNYTTGNFGSAQERLDSANAYVLTGNPAVVPGIVRLSAALALGAFVFARTRRFDGRGLIAFTTIALLIFFLQAQGWSPQWIVQIIPLLLLAFPSREGAILAALLTLLTFAEYPFLFLRTGDTGGVVSGELLLPFTLLVVMRTGLLALICWMLYRVLRRNIPASEPS